jgi:hypothetical protein
LLVAEAVDKMVTILAAGEAVADLELQLDLQ